MPQLSEWLKVMLSEIARKRDDAERAREEEVQRQREDARGDGADKKSDTRSATP